MATSSTGFLSCNTIRKVTQSSQVIGLQVLAPSRNKYSGSGERYQSLTKRGRVGSDAGGEGAKKRSVDSKRDRQVGQSSPDGNSRQRKI